MVSISEPSEAFFWINKHEGNLTSQNHRSAATSYLQKKRRPKIQRPQKSVASSIRTPFSWTRGENSDRDQNRVCTWTLLGSDSLTVLASTEGTSIGPSSSQPSIFAIHKPARSILSSTMQDYASRQKSCALLSYRNARTALRYALHRKRLLPNS